MKTRKFLIPSILWSYIGVVMFLILYDFSVHNMISVPTTILGVPLDKIVHFTMFFTFPIVIEIYRKYNPKVRWLKLDIQIFALGVAFAITTELLQLLLTSYRTFDILDIIADICGIIVGLVVIKIKLPNSSRTS